MDFLKDEITLKRALLYIFIAMAGLLAIKVLLKLLPLGILLFLFLAPPAFVLADAQERRVQRPVLWAVFTLFTSVFGLLVYLLARPEVQKRHCCPSCSGEIDPAFPNCPWCGRVVPQAGNCHSCGFALKAGWKFCPKCQVQVGSPSVSTAPVPPAPAAGNGLAPHASSGPEPLK